MVSVPHSLSSQVLYGCNIGAAFAVQSKVPLLVAKKIEVCIFAVPDTRPAFFFF